MRVLLTTLFVISSVVGTLAATTDLKTGSTLTLQAPLYDPNGVGEAAYGRYSLTDIKTNAFGVSGNIVGSEDIGVSVQAYDADLSTWAAVSPSTSGTNFVTQANYAAMRDLLNAPAYYTSSGSGYSLATGAKIYVGPDNPTPGTYDIWIDTDSTPSGGGDSVSIDGSAVVDPDFVSTGDIDFVNTSNTITANINANSVALGTDTTGTYIANVTTSKGLARSADVEGATVGLIDCANDNYVLKWDQDTSTWGCAADDSGTGSGTVGSGTTGQYAYYSGNGTTVGGRTLLASDGLLTGFSSGAGTVAGTDTILQAINKLDGNVGAKQASDADLTDLATKWAAASASGPATLQFAEDTDNGSNKVTVQGLATQAADATLTLGSTFTDAKWCSYATATGLTCNENAPAGTGDVTDVGDCTSGACLDGTSDGGTYLRLYDGTSAYESITGGLRKFTFASSTANSENVILTVGNNDNSLYLSSSTGANMLTLTSIGITSGGASDLSATSVEIPNGTGPTVDATGEIAVDTTGDQFLYYGGSAEKILMPTRTETTVWKVPAASDVLVFRAPFALTITQLDCVAVGSTPSVVVAYQECDSAGANCAATGASVTANGGDDADTSFTDAAIDSGDWVNVNLSSTSGTITYLSCSLQYVPTRQ